jgi:hypothetical protein
MNEEYINLIEPTPKLHSRKCRVLAFTLKLFLQYSVYIATAVAWYLYDYFIGGATLLLSFIIVGIIRAKLRNSAIPLTQREYHYSDEAIANWYSARILCIGEDKV